MSRATFLRLLRYVRPYKRLFRFNLLLTLLATLSQLLGPKFIQIGIDRYLMNIAGAQAAFRGILVVSDLPRQPVTRLGPVRGPGQKRHRRRPGRDERFATGGLR